MRLFINFLFILSLSSFLQAHQTGLSYLMISESDDAKIDLVYKKPLEDSQADEIRIVFPLKCNQVTPKNQTILDGFIIEKYSLWCSEDGLINSRIWIDGLVKDDKGILIRYEKNQIVESSLLRASTPFMLIDTKQSNLDIFMDYVKLGVVHILMGFDHLLFVLCLILLVTNMKTLLYSVTAFTLAHSITLAFGILDVFSVPIAYVEAMIALSIVFLARELIVKNEDSFTSKYLGVLTFIFGLLHGFGFSSVLTSIGLPQDEIPLALFSFNLGIEFGQIAFIIFASIIIYLVKKYLKNSYNIIEKISIYAIGGLSSFWLVQRVVAF